MSPGLTRSTVRLLSPKAAFPDAQEVCATGELDAKERVAWPWFCCVQMAFQPPA